MTKTAHNLGEKLVIATHNQGKLREIGALVAPFGVNVVSAGELGLPEPVEDGETFAANAEIKARAAANAAGLPALADDSGLAVTALGGQPGIYSARWAGPDKDFNLAMERVEQELAGKDDRSAHFVCALALCMPEQPDGSPGLCQIFEGTVHGTLVWPPRGDKGFGYDPVFQANGYDITFAEMAPDEKQAISHRAHAFDLLVKGVFGGQ